MVQLNVLIIEDHLLSLLQGSYDPNPPDLSPHYLGDHAYVQADGEQDPADPVPRLRNLDNGCSLETNPTGWLNS